MKFPQPNWIPDAFEDAADVGERMQFYTNGRRSFVVYLSGTTVFSGSALQGEDDDYHQALCDVVSHSPDFKVMPMEDANLLIRFAGPVCGLVFEKFYRSNERQITEYATLGGLLPGEVFLSPADRESIPDLHYYAGLFGRAKLYRDVCELQIAYRFSPIN